MHKINGDNTQMLINTVQGSGSLMLSVVSREGAWRGHSQGVHCLCKGCLKHTLNVVFTFFIKVKLSLDFLNVTK